MDTDEFKVLLGRLDHLQKGQDRIDHDLTTDRKDLENVALRLGSLENLVNEFRSSLRNQADKVKDKVEDAVQPMIDETKNLKESIDKKKNLNIQVKKPWWKWF